MAPLPPNGTARVWVDYSDGINDHSLMVRYDAEVTDASTALSAADAFLAALSPQLYLLTVTGARAQAAGTHISFPVVWDGDDTYGSGAMPGALAPRQLCFLGRTAGGRRVRWFVFGSKMDTPADFRFDLDDDASLENAYNIIVGSQLVGAFIAIDGANPVNYPYVDVNFNSYYEEKARG